MLGVLAYNHNAAFSFDYLAFLADLLYGWFNLHCLIPYLSLRILLLLFAGLLCTPSDSALGEVVNRNLNGYLIAGQYSDIIHSELSGNMSVYYMSVGELYLEVGVGQCLNHLTFVFYNIIFRHDYSSKAFSVFA